jgi:hypothetical protein
VYAQYNPKELQIKRPLEWGEHHDCVLEFVGAKARTFSVELLFDGFEQNQSVDPPLAKLEELATVHPFTKDGKRQLRPHHCVVVWGDQGIPRLTCVIESLVIKYTMFDREGTPLRATATVEFKEASKIEQKGKGGKTTK